MTATATAAGPETAVRDYETKDSGSRRVTASGMQREMKTGQPRFDLLVPLQVPYQDQLLTRTAALVERGARKYDSRDWEQASTATEMEEFRATAFRHFMQWMCGENDEDHAAAIVFNVLAAESTAYMIAHRTADSDGQTG